MPVEMVAWGRTQLANSPDRPARRNDITHPTLGHSGPSRKRRPVFSSWNPHSWTGGAVWCIDRIRLNLSVWFASFGNSSLRCNPDTRVGIGRNGPRTSEGADGFGSNVSRWAGPPTRLMKMQDL